MNRFEEADEAERIRLAPKVVEHFDGPVGTIVQHVTFGEGTIKDVFSMTNGGKYATIEFKDGSTREFRYPLETPWF